MCTARAALVLERIVRYLVSALEASAKAHGAGETGNESAGERHQTASYISKGIGDGGTVVSTARGSRIADGIGMRQGAHIARATRDHTGAARPTPNTHSVDHHSAIKRRMILYSTD
jgi:hypothetical protein